MSAIVDSVITTIVYHPENNEYMKQQTLLFPPLLSRKAKKILREDGGDRQGKVPDNPNEKIDKNRDDDDDDDEWEISLASLVKQNSSQNSTEYKSNKIIHSSESKRPSMDTKNACPKVAKQGKNQSAKTFPVKRIADSEKREEIKKRKLETLQPKLKAPFFTALEHRGFSPSDGRSKHGSIPQLVVRTSDHSTVNNENQDPGYGMSMNQRRLATCKQNRDSGKEGVPPQEACPTTIVSVADHSQRAIFQSQSSRSTSYHDALLESTGRDPVMMSQQQEPVGTAKNDTKVPPKTQPFNSRRRLSSTSMDYDSEVELPKRPPSILQQIVHRTTCGSRILRAPPNVSWKKPTWIRFEHPPMARITHLAWDNMGVLLAVASEDKWIRIYDWDMVQAADQKGRSQRARNKSNPSHPRESATIPPILRFRVPYLVANLVWNPYNLDQLAVGFRCVRNTQH